MVILTRFQKIQQINVKTFSNTTQPASLLNVQKQNRCMQRFCFCTCMEWNIFYNRAEPTMHFNRKWVLRLTSISSPCEGFPDRITAQTTAFQTWPDVGKACRHANQEETFLWCSYFTGKIRIISKVSFKIKTHKLRQSEIFVSPHRCQQ